MAQLSIRNLELSFGGHLYVPNDLPDVQAKGGARFCTGFPYKDPAIDGADPFDTFDTGQI
jgi:hypothetical protein